MLASETAENAENIASKELHWFMLGLEEGTDQKRARESPILSNLVLVLFFQLPIGQSKHT